MNTKQNVNLLRMMGCDREGARNIANHINSNAVENVIGTMIELYTGIDQLYASSFQHLNYNVAVKSLRDYNPTHILVDAWHQIHAKNYEPLIKDLIKK